MGNDGDVSPIREGGPTVINVQSPFPLKSGLANAAYPMLAFQGSG